MVKLSKKILLNKLYGKNLSWNEVLNTFQLSDLFMEFLNKDISTLSTLRCKDKNIFKTQKLHWKKWNYKLTYFNIAIVSEQHISSLDISMYDPMFMKKI